MGFLKGVLVVVIVGAVIGTILNVFAYVGSAGTTRPETSWEVVVIFVLAVGFLGVIKTLEANAVQSVRLTQAAVTDLAARLEALPRK